MATSGLDTRTGMDGFARGLSLGNNSFDRLRENDRYKQNREDKVAAKLEGDARYEENKIVEQERYDVREERAGATFDRQEENHKRDETLRNIGSIYQSWNNGAEPSKKDIEYIKTVSAKPGFKQFNMGILMNPDTGTHLDKFDTTMAQVGKGDYTSVNSPEFLTSFNYLYRDFIKGNGSDNLKRKVVGIVPARKADGTPDPGNVHLKLEITDKKTGKSYLAPATENGGTEAAGDNTVRAVPIQKILEIGTGRRHSYESFNQNPEVKSKLQSIMVQNGMIKAPASKEYAVGAWGDGNVLYNKDTGSIVNTSNNRSAGGNPAPGSKAYLAQEKDFFALQSKIAEARKSILAGGGGMVDEAALKEAIAPLEADLTSKYGVTARDILGYREALTASGQLDTLSLDGIRKHKRKKSELAKQRAQAKQEEASDIEMVNSMEAGTLMDATKPERGMPSERPENMTLTQDNEYFRALKIESELKGGKSGGRAMHSTTKNRLKKELADIKAKLPSAEQAPASIAKLDNMIASLEQSGEEGSEKQIAYYQSFKDAINKFVLNGKRARGMSLADSSGPIPSQI